MAGDPHFDSVVFLSHFDGVDGATVATDQSDSAHTITFTGAAQIDTAEKKWGASSLLLQKSGSSGVSCVDHPDFTLGASDFTLELWFRLASLPSLSFPDRFALLSHYNSVGAQRAWLWLLDSQQFTFTSRSDTAFLPTLSALWAPETTSWHHAAVARQGPTARMYLDGGKIQEANWAAAAIAAGTEPFKIGYWATGDFLDGWVDDVRLTLGTARYTGDTYVIPTQAFPDEFGSGEEPGDGATPTRPRGLSLRLGLGL